MNLIFKIVNNELVFMSEPMKDFYMKFFRGFNNSDKMLTMNLDEYSPYTSSGQQDLFKAILFAGVKQSGHTYAELESELLDLFSPFTYEKDMIGRRTKKRKSVAEMNNREFNVFLEQSNTYMSNMFDLDFRL